MTCMCIACACCSLYVYHEVRIPPSACSDIPFAVVQFDRRETVEALREWLHRHRASVIAIGNGTASRETQALRSSRRVTKVAYW